MTVSANEVKQIMVDVFSQRSLEEMGELLDSPFDLYDLGCIDSELEQKILNYLADETFVAVYAIHSWVHYKREYDFEYTFNAVVQDILKSL